MRPPGLVVLDGVGEEVRDEALDEARVAVGEGGRERTLDSQPVGVDAFERLCGDRGEVDRLAAVEAALAAREHEQRVDQAFLVLAGREHLAQHGAQPFVAGVGVGERDLDQRALVGERRAQLVRDVGGELALGLERGLEPLEQRVEGAAELAQLVVGAAQGEAPVEVAGGDLPRGGGDRAQRPQRAAGDEPAEPGGEQRHDREGDARLDQQRAERGVG